MSRSPVVPVAPTPKRSSSPRSLRRARRLGRRGWLANGVNANQLWRWMRERGVEPPVLSSLPAGPVADVAAEFVPVEFPRNTDSPIRVELY